MHATLTLFLAVNAALIVSIHAFMCGIPQNFRNVVLTKTIACTPKADVNALPDSKRRLSEISAKLEENLSPNVINFDQLVGSVNDLEHTTIQPGFWDDPDQAQSTLTELNNARAAVKRVTNWKQKVDDISTLIEMVTQEKAEIARKFCACLRSFIMFIKLMLLQINA